MDLNIVKRCKWSLWWFLCSCNNLCMCSIHLVLFIATVLKSVSVSEMNKSGSNFKWVSGIFNAQYLWTVWWTIHHSQRRNLRFLSVNVQNVHLCIKHIHFYPVIKDALKSRNIFDFFRATKKFMLNVNFISRDHIFHVPIN